MMIFNVETHGDIRFCSICRRYIVTIAKSPQHAPTPFIAYWLSWLVAPMERQRFFTLYKRVSLKPSTRSPCVPTAGAGRQDIGLDGPGRRTAARDVPLLQ